MYIPLPPLSAPVPVARAAGGPAPPDLVRAGLESRQTASPGGSTTVSGPSSSSTTTPPPPPPAQPSDNTNVTIGAVVGVVLGVFLIGIFAFLYTYRNSVRFSSKKKHKRRKSAGSKSSKASSLPAEVVPAPDEPAGG